MSDILRGRDAVGTRVTLTAASTWIMAVSTIAGIAFGSTLIHQQITLPAKHTEAEQPIESPPSQTASPEPESFDPTYGGQIDGSYTAAEDRAHQAAEFTIPGAYDPIGMGWECPAGAKGKLAIKSLTKAIHQKPKTSNAYCKLAWSNAYCKRAWVYYTMGQFAKATKDANKSIRLDPTNAERLPAELLCARQRGATTLECP